MYSIYHFFKNLIDNKKHFKKVVKLENFLFDNKLLSFQSKGKFPDMAIRLNSNKELLTGGKLIELKDSNSYNIASFNSTIPTGTKEIKKIVKSKKSGILKQMKEAGDDVESLPLREVFYLIRGRQKDNLKICLVHGSFFETIKKIKLAFTEEELSKIASLKIKHHLNGNFLIFQAFLD